MRRGDANSALSKRNRPAGAARRAKGVLGGLLIQAGLVGLRGFLLGGRFRRRLGGGGFLGGSLGGRLGGGGGGVAGGVVRVARARLGGRLRGRLGRARRGGGGVGRAFDRRQCRLVTTRGGLELARLCFFLQRRRRVLRLRDG